MSNIVQSVTTVATVLKANNEAPKDQENDDVCNGNVKMKNTSVYTANPYRVTVRARDNPSRHLAGVWMGR